MIRSGGQVVYETKGDTLVIRVGGEIDHHSAVAVRAGIDEQILEARPGRVLLELSRVDFMDSSGLGLIMGRFALVSKYGGKFAVLDPSPAVLKILRLAGMDRMITVLKTKDKKKGNEHL
ncbi:MAG: anti-sigma factor antagonist [Clostridia bacterium]|nr:anti-sigma factor antagonist [Clostridia bacterium]